MDDLERILMCLVGLALYVGLMLSFQWSLH